MRHTADRCRDILAWFRTPFVGTIWASFALYWLRRWWAASGIHSSFVSFKPYCLVCVAHGACGVVMGWYLRGRWTHSAEVSGTRTSRSDEDRGDRFVGAYNDSKTSQRWTIQVGRSHFIEGWKDGKVAREAQGKLGRSGRYLEVIFGGSQTPVQGSLEPDGSIRWSNGAMWLPQN